MVIETGHLPPLECSHAVGRGQHGAGERHRDGGGKMQKQPKGAWRQRNRGGSDTTQQMSDHRVFGLVAVWKMLFAQTSWG